MTEGMIIQDSSTDRIDFYIDEDGDLTLRPLSECEYYQWEKELNSMKVDAVAEVKAMRDVLNKWLGEAPEPPADAQGVESLNESLLRLAISHGRTVAFTYAKGSGEVLEHRRLAPTTFMKSIGQKVVVGLDTDRDDYRTYRLDRIKGDVVLV